MSHGRFMNPAHATIAGIWDLFSHGQLADRYSDDLRADGKTCLVTGASSGLGYAVAVELARRGARILTVSRSGIPEKGEAICRESGSDAVEMLQADLSDMAQVRSLADLLRDRGERIDVVVENAGVATPHARETAQGLDAMFATNYMAKVLLLRRLLADGTIQVDDAVRGRPRIVIVSSESHRGASAIDWGELGSFYRYGVNKGIHNYSYFKLVLNTFACELARRLNPGGAIRVPVHVVCPGPVDTEILRDAPPALMVFMKLMFRLFFRDPVVAARPVVHICLAPEFGHETNRYLHMFNPKLMDEKCYDAAQGRRLWDWTEDRLRQLGTPPD